MYDSPLPIEKLHAGIYRFRVVIVGSTCTRDAKTESASRTFSIRVRYTPGDAPGGLVGALTVRAATVR